jgi:hypothetical protein
MVVATISSLPIDGRVPVVEAELGQSVDEHCDGEPPGRRAYPRLSV